MIVERNRRAADCPFAQQPLRNDSCDGVRFRAERDEIIGAAPGDDGEILGSAGSAMFSGCVSRTAPAAVTRAPRTSGVGGGGGGGAGGPGGSEQQKMVGSCRQTTRKSVPLDATDVSRALPLPLDEIRNGVTSTLLTERSKRMPSTKLGAPPPKLPKPKLNSPTTYARRTVDPLNASDGSAPGSASSIG